MQQYRRRKKDVLSADDRKSSETNRQELKMPGSQMQPVNSPGKSLVERYQAGISTCKEKVSRLPDVTGYHDSRTISPPRGSRKLTTVNYRESSVSDFEESFSADMSAESPKNLKKHSKGSLPLTSLCMNGPISKPKLKQAPSSNQWPLPINPVLKKPQVLTCVIPPAASVLRPNKREKDVTTEAKKMKTAAPSTPCDFAPQLKVRDESILQDQDCNLQSASVRKHLPSTFTKLKKLKDDSSKAQQLAVTVASTPSDPESESGDEYTPSSNGATTDEESSRKTKKGPRVTQQEKKTDTVDGETLSTEKIQSKRTKGKVFGLTKMAVNLRPQALKSFEEGDRTILELPQSFDVDGDAGAIGRFSVSSKADTGLVFDLKGTIYDGQLLPACGSLCVVTLTGEKAEVDYMTNTFVRLDETWAMDDAERILEGALSADDEDGLPQQVPSEKKRKVEKPKAKPKPKGKTVRGSGRRSKAAKA